MGENVYKVIELIGTSTVAEKAAAAAVARAGKTFGTRVAEVVELGHAVKKAKSKRTARRSRCRLVRAESNTRFRSPSVEGNAPALPAASLLCQRREVLHFVELPDLDVGIPASIGLAEPADAFPRLALPDPVAGYKLRHWETGPCAPFDPCRRK